LDPNLAEAHAGIGWVKMYYDWDWAAADAAMQRALLLGPGDAVTLRRAAVLASTQGRFDEAIQLDRRAAAADPLSPSTWLNLSSHASYAGRLDEATAAGNKALEIRPDQPAVRYRLGSILLAQGKLQEALTKMETEPEPLWRQHGLTLAYHALGRKKEADAALSDFVAKFQDNAAFQIAEVYAYRGEVDQAFAWLDRAYAQRDTGLAEIKGDRLLRSLEQDPRYAALLRKMRLPV
jgi:tetratricopeptide (TPR) repeat protein